MSTLWKKFFEIREEISLFKIALSLFALVVIRTFIENFSSPYYTGTFFPPKEAYLHFPVYYFSVFLTFSLILYAFTKKPLNQIANFLIKPFFFILIPPIVDLVVTRGRGDMMSYVITGPQNFAYLFLKLMDPRGYAGITMGIHVAAYLIFFCLAVFTYKATKNLKKSLLVVFVSYSALFLYAISPSLIALPYHLNNNQKSADISYQETIKESWLFSNEEAKKDFVLNIFNSSSLNQVQGIYDSPITQLFYIALVFQSLLFFSITYPKLWGAIKKDLRLARIFFWIIISAIGILAAESVFEDIVLLNFINLASLIVFFVLIVLNIWLAVCINDQQDIKIDQISNPNRPLADGSFNISEWNSFQLILIFLMLPGFFILNSIAIFFILFAQMVYYIYSVEPFKLKNHYLTSSVAIGAAAMAIFSAGFFMFSTDNTVSVFPIKSALLLGLSIAIISGFKDIKDFEGDKKFGIKTLPVIFGLEKSKTIITFLLAAVFVAVPFLLEIKFLFLFSLALSIAMFYVIKKSTYREKNVFFLILLYTIGVIGAYFWN